MLFSKFILWRIFITTLIVICTLSVTFYIPGSPYIRCVQCSSVEMSPCIDNPPPPISCLKKEKFCQTVTRTNTSGGVVSLLRDCASISSDGCIRDDGVIVCTSTCDQPGCNHGDRLYLSRILFLFYVSISVSTCLL